MKGNWSEGQFLGKCWRAREGIVGGSEGIRRAAAFRGVLAHACLECTELPQAGNLRRRCSPET